MSGRSKRVAKRVVGYSLLAVAGVLVGVVAITADQVMRAEASFS